jgi:hypothetical protein
MSIKLIAISWLSRRTAYKYVHDLVYKLQLPLPLRWRSKSCKLEPEDGDSKKQEKTKDVDKKYFCSVKNMHNLQ